MTGKITGALREQSDWAQQDENRLGFIKNKPFYDNRKSGPLTIEWDGEIGGRDTLDFMGLAWVKMTNATPSYEELCEATFDLVCPEELKDFILPPLVSDGTSQGFPFIGVGDSEGSTAYCMVFPNDCTIEGTFCPKGLYLTKIAPSEGHVLFVKSIYFPSVTTGELKTIDPKYLPSEASEKKFVFRLNDLECSDLGNNETKFRVMLALLLLSPERYYEFQVTGDFTKADEWAKIDELKVSPLYIFDNTDLVPATFISTGYISAIGNKKILCAFSCGASIVHEGKMLELKMFFQRTSLNGGTIYAKADILNP